MARSIREAAQLVIEQFNNRLRRSENKIRQELNPIIYVPSNYSQPFSTNVVIDGRVQKAVKIDCGNLPNNSTKVISVPQEIKDLMDPGTVNFYHNLCYAYDADSRLTIPLPYVAIASGFLNTTDRSVTIAINSNGDVTLESRSNLSGLVGVITISYLEVEV